MKSFIFLTFLVISGPSAAQSDIFDPSRMFDDQGATIITDPAISRRCFKLIGDRQKKLSVKQKIRGLIERNQYLQKATPINKEIVKDKLQVSMRNLKNELILIDTRLTYLEESIIRKGCPGIQL